jgi:predicted nucleic acid-binding protein
LNLYLDASVIVPLFAADVFNERADALVSHWQGGIIVSNFAAAEFVSAVSRRVRAGELTTTEARAALAGFDIWVADAIASIPTERADIEAAIATMRRLDLPLRAGDAIHVATAMRHKAALATFDIQMSRSAAKLGLALATT